jgi:hypothetical protein
MPKHVPLSVSCPWHGPQLPLHPEARTLRVEQSPAEIGAGGETTICRYTFRSLERLWSHESNCWMHCAAGGSAVEISPLLSQFSGLTMQLRADFWEVSGRTALKESWDHHKTYW